MTAVASAPDAARLRSLYLDAIERIVCNTVYRDGSLDRFGVEHPHDAVARDEGRDWPAHAFTMIGVQRLRHLRRCVEQLLADDVRGDLLEAGVWRGGASIVMRAVLVAYGATDRRVWLADSFRGLPVPNAERYPADAGLDLSGIGPLAVPLDAVRANFASLGLLDESIRFVPGWFSDTLPALDVSDLALLRLDGDLYESTIVALESLYPKISPGGFVVVDDYGCVPACRAAVDAYRERAGVREPLRTIDWTGAYWRKAS